MAGFLPKWRKFTWIVVIVNVLFLAWMILGVASWFANCTGQTMHDLSLCRGAGTGMAVGFIVGAAIDIFLGVIWLVTQSHPAGAEAVKR